MKEHHNVVWGIGFEDGKLIAAFYVPKKDGTPGRLLLRVPFDRSNAIGYGKEWLKQAERLGRLVPVERKATVARGQFGGGGK